jgi:hypothetical protein
MLGVELADALAVAGTVVVVVLVLEAIAAVELSVLPAETALLVVIF